MLNLFQHLIKSIRYETLKRVQGDRICITTQSLEGEGQGAGDFEAVALVRTKEMALCWVTRARLRLSPWHSYENRVLH